MSDKKENPKSRRLRERLRITLPVRVRCRETVSREWHEVGRLLDISPFGARIELAHPMETGRLLHFTMPLPRQLRVFDYAEDHYKIWGVVRHVKLVHDEKKNERRYEIGVAFIGKLPPDSYQKDPSTRYDASGQDEKNGLMFLRERRMNKDWATNRRSTRLSVPLEVIIETFDARGEINASEQTVTENISRHGASVYSSLTVERGEFVRLSDARRQQTLIAVVRGSRTGADRLPRIHLEFIGEEWKLEGSE